MYSIKTNQSTSLQKKEVVSTKNLSFKDIAMPINTNTPSSISTSQNPTSITDNKSKTPTKIQFELSNALYQMQDLILPATTRSQLQKAVGLHRYQKEVFENWGFSQTHKFDNKMIINLYGEPGTGKTMSAHAIAHELGRKLILVNYGDIESKYVGETPKNIQAVFEFAKAQNAILFFDEADAILSRRVTNMTSATDTSVNQTRSVMLTLLNDYNDTVIFATNFISNYDPAFMRRILIHIEYTLPDEKTREQLFSKYIPKQLPHNFNLSEIIKISEGLSGSDIANAVLLSAFSAKTDNMDMVTHDNLKEKIYSIQKSKQENMGTKTNISTKIVSEDYVKTQLHPGETL